MKYNKLLTWYIYEIVRECAYTAGKGGRYNEIYAGGPLWRNATLEYLQIGITKKRRAMGTVVYCLSQ